MTAELSAIVLTAAFQFAGLVTLGVMIYRAEQWRDRFDGTVLRSVGEIRDALGKVKPDPKH